MERPLSIEDMLEILNMDVQRKRFFVIKWIEDHLGRDKEGQAFVKEVAVRLTDEFSYEIENGKVKGVVLYEDMLDFFEDYTKPTFQELELLSVAYPKRFKWLVELCFEMRDAFDHPHSCTIDYFTEQKNCCGCNRIGPVNYIDENENTRYYCGNSERCLP